MNINLEQYNINTAQYFKVDGEIISIKAVIDGTNYSVPLDSANRHYQAIQEWVKEGNKIEDAD
tara:strand:- start:136 stop:324 length:189 start_codon:yes stop_codon:yes gene_type:complete